ncbi:MAG: HD domain-containing protein [Pseudomonadota bacterium]
MTSDSTSLSSDNIVPFLHDIFTRRGGEEYLGEPVTMAQHMLQGATLAQENNETELVIVAALLHDVGHFTSEFGMFSMDDTKDKFHEHAGAQVLQKFFPSLVVDCVRHHVAAKRYLCAVDKAYFNQLSEASVHSLNLQGGPMNDKEIKAFECEPNLAQIVRVRRYDDAGKSPTMETPAFDAFMPMVQRVVDSHCRSVTHES